MQPNETKWSQLVTRLAYYVTTYQQCCVFIFEFAPTSPENRGVNESQKIYLGTFVEITQEVLGFLTSYYIFIMITNKILSMSLAPN